MSKNVYKILLYNNIKIKEVIDNLKTYQTQYSPPWGYSKNTQLIFSNGLDVF